MDWLIKLEQNWYRQVKELTAISKTSSSQLPLPFSMPSFAHKLVFVGILVLVAAGAFGVGYRQGRGTAVPVVVSKPAPAQGAITPATAASPIAPGMRPTPNASAEMKEFMANRATLAQRMADLRRSTPNGAADPKLFAQFQKENAALLQRQRELSQALPQQQGQHLPGVVPEMPIPATASPEMKAYLTARNQLMREQMEFMSQHRTDDPATRQAAMLKWRQDHAARFQDLQQKSRAMNPGHPSNNPNPPPPTPKTQ